MEITILERSFTQQVFILEIKEPDFDNHFRRYKMHFSLSPTCNIICWIDFGNDNNLRVYEIVGRNEPTALIQLGQFLSHQEWLKSMIELKS